MTMLCNMTISISHNNIINDLFCSCRRSYCGSEIRLARTDCPWRQVAVGTTVYCLHHRDSQLFASAALFRQHNPATSKLNGQLLCYHTLFPMCQCSLVSWVMLRRPSWYRLRSDFCACAAQNSARQKRDVCGNAPWSTSIWKHDYN